MWKSILIELPSTHDAEAVVVVSPIRGVVVPVSDTAVNRVIVPAAAAENAASLTLHTDFDLFSIISFLCKEKKQKKLFYFNA